MRLTLLLSLAVAAAASPTLNVTLTNNLVGVTTVRVTGAGLRVEATLGADNSLFHARYREVHVADGRTTITRQSPRPHHAGTASGEADGEVFTDGRATAVIEQGRTPARKGRHGGGAGALARHVRPVDVAVGAPPARLLRRRAAAAAAAAAEPVPGDATITRGVVVCAAGAVVAADGLVGKTSRSDHLLRIKY